MDTASAMRPGRPPSIQELVAQAENFAFNVNIPLRHWIRTAETLCQEAAFAMSDSDYGRAYMMLYRHSVLVLNYLATHPEYKDPLGRKSVKALQARIGDVIQELEMLKPAIESSRLEWERMRPETPQHPTPTRLTPENAAALPALYPRLHSDFGARARAIFQEKTRKHRPAIAGRRPKRWAKRPKLRRRRRARCLP
ncbi:hypothetical protein NLG97_g6225 [Lecanicillium saksenae]|uniref:Uncharacterized protein n=1 Tax=Lecanicillium saksenae TaxID=468837 RepID=A0ACC1QTE9_9HYPO|nr:hypothetical protein NLG97_g6225 [Lecanicillium saksenae]